MCLLLILALHSVLTLPSVGIPILQTTPSVQCTPNFTQIPSGKETYFNCSSLMPSYQNSSTCIASGCNGTWQTKNDSAIKYEEGHTNLLYCCDCGTGDPSDWFCDGASYEENPYCQGYMVTRNSGASWYCDQSSCDNAGGMIVLNSTGYYTCNFSTCTGTVVETSTNPYTWECVDPTCPFNITLYGDCYDATHTCNAPGPGDGLGAYLKKINGNFTCPDKNCTGTMLLESNVWTCVNPTCTGYMQHTPEMAWICVDPHCTGTEVLQDSGWTCQDPTCTGTLEHNSAGYWYCNDTRCPGSMEHNSQGWTCQDNSCTGTMMVNATGYWVCNDPGCMGSMIQDPTGDWTCYDSTCTGNMICNSDGSWVCQDFRCTGSMARVLGVWECQDATCPGNMQHLSSGLWYCNDTTCVGSMTYTSGSWQCQNANCTGSMQYSYEQGNWSCVDKSCGGTMVYSEGNDTWTCSQSSCSGTMQYLNGRWQCVTPGNNYYGIALVAILVIVLGIECFCNRRKKSNKNAKAQKNESVEQAQPLTQKLRSESSIELELNQKLE